MRVDEIGWHIVGPYEQYTIDGCSVTIEARPHYCDRGHWLGKAWRIPDLDAQDGFPRYYMDKARGKAELSAWLHWRLKTASRTSQAPQPAPKPKPLTPEQLEAEELYELCMRQGSSLTHVVNALRGEPPPLTLWSHHDAPELARAARVVIDAARKNVQGDEGLRASLEQFEKALQRR